MSGPRILIMAGGTGGHIFPALAVARELSARGAEILWLGSRGGMEGEIVPREGYPIEFITVSGLRGKGAAGWLMAPLRLSRALWQALRVMRRWRPAAVLGMGGFVTGPGGVAARLLGVPLLIHEQNAVAGLTNRLLSRIANRVMEAFPGTFPRAIHTGNPVRAEIAALAPPAGRYEGRGGPLRLLVVGGSLGAAALNQVVPAAVARLPEGARPEVRHQTGQRNFETARQHYAEAGVAAELMPFVAEMGAAYEWADLVLCRAGAITVCELAAAGVPALLVPFPHAVDDHQTHNARFLVREGAALLLPQAGVTPDALAATLAGFAGPEGRARLAAMAEAARLLARPDAARRVAELCLAATGVDP